VSYQYSIDVVNILRAVWDCAAEASDSEELTEAEYRAQRREAITSAAGRDPGHAGEGGAEPVSDCAHVWIYHPGTEMEWRCIRCQAIDGPLVPPSDQGGN
jgi:hypothetical protein